MSGMSVGSGGASVKATFVTLCQMTPAMSPHYTSVASVR